MTLALVYDKAGADDGTLQTLIAGPPPTSRQDLLAQAVRTLALAQPQERALADVALLLVILERFDLLSTVQSASASAQRARMIPEAIERCDALETALLAAQLQEWHFIVLILRAEMLLQRRDEGAIHKAM